MSDLTALQALAAEYVLGTLSPEERADVTLRRMVEPELDEEIDFWEARLAPLSAATLPASPSANLFAKIIANLPPVAAAPAVTRVANDNLAALKRQLGRWRATALGAGALAASLVLGVGAQQYAGLQQPKNFVAVLQKDANSPAFIVAVNVETRALTVRPVSATAPQGKSYELWLINDKIGAPKSLGVVEKAGYSAAPKLKGYAPDVVEASLYAITLEQEGGSPDGKPSGAPVFTGKLVAE